KGENISTLPEFEPLPDDIDLEVLLKVGDNVSTDEIMPAGSRVLPYRSNIPKISEFVYIQVDDTYATRAVEHEGGHAIVGGENYGQGSSREHAVIAPRYLGLRVVVAKSLARIHWQNLANFGVLALEFTDDSGYEDLSQGDVLAFRGLRDELAEGRTVTAEVDGRTFEFRHGLSPRQVEMVLAGGRIAQRAEHEAQTSGVSDRPTAALQPCGCRAAVGDVRAQRTPAMSLTMGLRKAKSRSPTTMETAPIVRK